LNQKIVAFSAPVGGKAMQDFVYSHNGKAAQEQSSASIAAQINTTATGTEEALFSTFMMTWTVSVQWR
jgi:hypothetical protein